MRSLRTWLAVGLVVGITVPACAGVLGWVAAGSWQTQRQLARRDAAARVVANAPQASEELATQLSAMGVEAELAPVPFKPLDGTSEEALKKMKLAATVIQTPGLSSVLNSREGKQRLQKEFTDYHVTGGVIDATLWVRNEGATARWAAALGAAAVALAGVLFLAVALLSRWVLRPLASLARDADRIAGGELTVEPVDTRAREVAQVGDALSGMAGALETALGASAAAERERRFMVSAIAHDLRTPLFTLRGSLEAIEHGINDPGALARAQRKAAHLDHLVGDLFAFSRAENARDECVLEPIDLTDIARRAIETVAPAPLPTAGDVAAAPAAAASPTANGAAASPAANGAAGSPPAAAVSPAANGAAGSPPAGAVSKRARVRVELVAARPVPLRGDPVALERVLTNVLDNAVRHARSVVTVGVRGEAEAVVEVVDDGPGFAEADLPHAFEPLFRGDRARSGGGAGLGLAIARRLARAHGGDVVAVNDPAGGARVTVTLPYSGASVSTAV